MKFSTYIAGLLSVFLTLNGIVPAFETDQYNLPPSPLADIGEEVSEYVDQQILVAIENVNSEISRRKLCAQQADQRAKGCGPVASELEKLTYLRSPRAIADKFSDLMAGDRLTTTRFGGWIYKHKFRGQPDRYKAGYSETIYTLNLANYVTLSPTVRLYGVELGIDKLEHFFQQGYQYYEIERKALEKGSSRDEAVRKAIDWGKKTERTYYGIWSSGVYSNGDLYANYAGLRFYEGLAKPVTLGEKVLAPIAVVENGQWKRNTDRVVNGLLRPFVSLHMNEAFNPSSFRLTLVRSVRRAVDKNACPDWHRVYPRLTADELRKSSAGLVMWNGEDYGYTKPSRVVSVADECFEKKAPVRE